MKKAIVGFVVLWAFFTLNFILVTGTIDASRWSNGLVGGYFCLVFFLLVTCFSFGMASESDKN